MKTEDFNYPTGFRDEIVFPEFTKEDVEKIQTLYEYPLPAELVEFWQKNQNNKSSKTCVVENAGDQQEVLCFLDKWLSSEEIAEEISFFEEDLLNISEFEVETKQISSLRREFIIIGKTDSFTQGSIIVGLTGKNAGKVFLLDEERGQDMYIPIDYLEEAAPNINEFEKLLIDFDAQKEREDLFW